MDALGFLAARLGSLLGAVLLCVSVLGVMGVPLPARAADPWLFVNDVHFNPLSRRRRPVTHADTNPALLASTLDELQRVAPHPPVIVMAGDFLSHSFKPATAVPTMVALAARFGHAFPHAQFVIALGNEDSACGDYGVATNSSFLQAVAKAWAPLVNRNGAAPDFARTFARDGFYTARLPLSGVRAVVVDDAFWSPRYHAGCGTQADPTPESFADLDRALQPAGSERRWLIMHIPPGIDAYSTIHYFHRLAIVPFLRPEPRDRVLNFISDPARRVEVVITGHVHRFAYRIVQRRDAAPVPLLVSPAVSPIFGNSPSFLTADVAADGVIRNLEEHALVDRRWRDVGGLATLGVSEFTGPELLGLQHRLLHDPDLRARFASLYVGDSRQHDVNERDWRSYWCVASEFNATGFRDCVDAGGFSFLTRRGVVVAAIAIVGVLLVGAAASVVVVAVVRRRRAISGG